MSSVAAEPIRVVTAGRTDAGVHGLAQVIHFDTHAQRPVTAWVRATNSLLPAPIRVLWAHEVSNAFHARYSARSRSYIYLLYNHPLRPGFLYRRVGWYHRPLNESRMQQAAALLVGEHDFSAFRAAQCQAKSPVRNVLGASVERRGEFIVLRFQANAFLHHMVRNIVGSLVYVGAGKQPVEWIGALLEGRDRTHAAPTFAPDGLYLAGIEYDPSWGLPAFPPHAYAYPLA